MKTFENPFSLMLDLLPPGKKITLSTKILSSGTFVLMLSLTLRY